MWSGRVVSTPGTGSAGSDNLGAAGLVTDVVVDETVPLVPMAVPPVVFSQPTARPADRHSRPAVPSAADL